MIQKTCSERICSRRHRLNLVQVLPRSTRSRSGFGMRQNQSSSHSNLNRVKPQCVQCNCIIRGSFVIRGTRQGFRISSQRWDLQAAQSYTPNQNVWRTLSSVTVCDTTGREGAHLASLLLALGVLFWVCRPRTANFGSVHWSLPSAAATAAAAAADAAPPPPAFGGAGRKGR